MMSSTGFGHGIVGLRGTSVPVAIANMPSTATVGRAAEISSPSEISNHKVSRMTEGTSPSVTTLVGCDEASSVVRCSEQAERKTLSLNASTRYDKASSVVPWSEFGDSPSLRASSSYRRQPSTIRLWLAGGADAVRCVYHTLSGMGDSSSKVVDLSTKSLPSPEYTVHGPVKDPSSLSLAMYNT
jgi:hypothetical protein